jgi:nucleotidyltransferase/DNA polymerase involved in DNA repair
VVEAGTQGSAFIDLSYECHELQFVEGVSRIIEKRFQLHSFTSIAPNKFVDWAASRVAKPGKVTVIDEGDKKDFLKDLPVCFLPASSRTLERLELLGIHRIGQLASLSLAVLGKVEKWTAVKFKTGLSGSLLSGK